MAFWRELMSGSILCVLCCSAVIYSFSPSKLQTTGASDCFANNEDLSDAGQTSPTPPATGHTPPLSTNEPMAEAVVASAESIEANAGRSAALVIPQELAAAPVPARDEVRWLQVPADVVERPLIAAEPTPWTGNLARPESEAQEAPMVIASDRGIEPNEEDGSQSPDVIRGPLLQPEFVTSIPSLVRSEPLDTQVDTTEERLPGTRLSKANQSEAVAQEEAASSQNEYAGTEHAGDPTPLAAPAEPLSPAFADSETTTEADRVVWHAPTGLLARIEALSKTPETTVWAKSVALQIDDLGRAMQEQSADTGRLLAGLDAAVLQADAMADRASTPAVEAHLQRAAHALRRRLDVWRHADWLADPEYRKARDFDGEWAELVVCLDQIDEFMGDSPVAQAWREYLLFDSLREWASNPEREDEYAGRELARASLERLTQIPMDSRQRHFIANEPVVRLKGQLQRVAAGPIDLGRMLANLERYEQTRTVDDARRIARDYRWLALANSDKERALAAQLTMHYRNANFRFAVSASLLNRLMPEREPEVAAVNDIVLGLRAQGRRATSTDMQVSLIPDPRRARLALDVQGRIYSQTTSSSGPATFLTNSLGWYFARKPLELGLDGIRLSPAEVQVSNDLQLRDVRTDFDGLPLVGSLVSSVARSQHAQSQPAANAEIRAKIYHQAKSRIDQEADERLAEVTARLQTKLLEPMRRLRLDPVMIDAQTTEDRINMRIRLAGEEQLGSHTPRPRASSDSLASVQLHESVINNSLDRLDLGGRTFTLPELAQHVANRLNNDGWLQLDPNQEEVSIAFAAKDPVAVRCEEGRICVTLRIDRLKHERRVWRDFQVQAFYRPETKGLSAELVRDGVIQLSGDRLPLGSQIALRGIFVRIFARQRPWSLVPQTMAENPKLADLEVTQFVIDDGWIGLALGPQAPAARVRRILR